MLLEFLLLIACLVFIWHRHAFNYWKRHNVAAFEITPFLGNFKEVISFKRAFYQQIYHLYNSSSQPLMGFYMLQRPALLLRDLNLIKQILVKDFNSFQNRVIAADPIHDPLGDGNILFVGIPRWRGLRTRLTPLFTSAKLKQMYPLMVEIAHDLEAVLQKLPAHGSIEIKNLANRFSIDNIGSIVFGLRANSLSSDNSEFFANCMQVMEISLKRSMEFSSFYILPALAAFLHTKMFSEPATNFLRSSICYTMGEREKSGIKRNDLIDTLIEMRQAAAEDATNPANQMDFLVAQAGAFLVAGYETSASTISFALFEIANNQNIQNRLRAEIIEAFGNDKHIAYERLVELPYLSQIIDETLRKYPVLAHLERSFTPAAHSECYSMQPYADFNLPKGMPIFISNLGMHRDEKYWPQANKFDPERFSPENRSSINWDAYLPFGAGPRNCIGMRLGSLQSKLGLVHILRNYRVTSSVQSFEFDEKCVTLSPKGGLTLNIEKL